MQSLREKNVSLTYPHPRFCCFGKSSHLFSTGHFMPTDALLSSAPSLKQRGCNATWLCPPLTLRDFSLLLLATSAQFLLEMYTYSSVQLPPQAEKKTLWAAGPCSNLSSSSSWLPHPTCCHPLLDTLSLSWVPQQTPSPNHGPTQGTPSLTQSLSASALPAACVTECQCLLSCTLQVYFYSLGKPNAVNTKIHIIHDGLKYTLYMMACIWRCLLSVKIPNWLSPGTCTVLPINSIVSQMSSWMLSDKRT